MMQDRNGNRLTTRSQDAAEHYCRGLDLFLAAQPGGPEQLMLALEADDSFALASADLARMHQICARPDEARVYLDRAVELAGGISAREQGHIEIMRLLLDGQGQSAYQLIQQHVLAFPCDLFAIQPCCGVFGLIGFSGRRGREAENLAFMRSLSAANSGDWWFDSQYAFALCEVGQIEAAASLNEKALSTNPMNANAIHHAAHIHYEAGELAQGQTTLATWRVDYDRTGLLHGHLAWHDALCLLDQGEVQAAWSVLQADILPDVSQALPINTVTDVISLLLRAELQGQPRDDVLWQLASAYAEQHFSTPGLSFVDAHSVVAHAIAGNQSALALFRGQPQGFAGDLVATIHQAFGYFVAQQWADAITQLTAVVGVHERLGGSRAQRDFLELALIYAHTQAGQPAQARNYARMRRPFRR